MSTKPTNNKKINSHIKYNPPITKTEKELRHRSDERLILFCCYYFMFMRNECLDVCHRQQKKRKENIIIKETIFACLFLNFYFDELMFLY